MIGWSDQSIRFRLLLVVSYSVGRSAENIREDTSHEGCIFGVLWLQFCGYFGTSVVCAHGIVTFLSDGVSLLKFCGLMCCETLTDHTIRLSSHKLLHRCLGSHRHSRGRLSSLRYKFICLEMLWTSCNRTSVELSHFAIWSQDLAQNGCLRVH